MERIGNQGSTAPDKWRDYTLACREFARKVRNFQAITAQANPDRSAVETALLEVEKARVRYRTCRDRMAQDLLPTRSRDFLGQTTPGTAAAGDQRHVKELAELLWESAGRMHGTADQDWFRAEEIVRSAASV